MDVDQEKLRSPVDRLKYPKDLVPTIENDDVWLTRAEASEMEQKLRGIAIPIFLGPPTAVGCDGTGFEFQHDHLFFGARLHWWENEPPEWRPFTQAVRRAIKTLDDRREGKR